MDHILLSHLPITFIVFLIIAATLTLADTFKIGYLSGNRNPDGDIDISLPGLSTRYLYNIATLSFNSSSYF